MKKYLVTFTYERTYTVEVEAKDKQKAEQKAFDGEWSSEERTLDETNHEIISMKVIK
jgi:hypothetical protein